MAASAADRPRAGLRSLAARGVMVNSAFTIALQTLALIRGFAVAIFISREDYGIWGILVVGLSMLTWMANLGIGDKFVQQDEDDQELAFQRAFTLELMAQSALAVIMLASIPLIVLLYDESALVLPAIAIAATLPFQAFWAPVWVFYRNMDFFRQRLILAIDPVSSFVVTVGLAAAGAGYWAFVWGIVAGRILTGIGAVAMSPFALRLRRDAGALREYASFSGPILVAGASGMLVAQSSMLVGKWEVGLAGVGTMALATTITFYADKVSEVLMRSLYPALCAAKDRTDVLFESFVKSNRLALMWAVPLGIGLTLFAPDLTTYVLGEKWVPAAELLQYFGAAAAIAHVGFNWGAFYMARGITKPQAVHNLIAAVTFFMVPIPLLIADGLRGFGIGMVLHVFTKIAVRAYYLRKMFHGFRMLPHMLRGWIPTIPAVACILLLRLVEQDERTFPIAAGEVALYLSVTVAMTYLVERTLLRESFAYLRRRPAAVPAT